jgi:hypothetical protein
MAIPQSKIYYEPRSIAHFDALEQTCRLHQLSGSRDKYFFSASGVDQGYSINSGFSRSGCEGHCEGTKFSIVAKWTTRLNRNMSHRMKGPTRKKLRFPSKIIVLAFEPV